MPSAYTKLLTVKFLLNCIKIWERFWSYENFKKLKFRGDLCEKMCFFNNFSTYEHEQRLKNDYEQSEDNCSSLLGDIYWQSFVSRAKHGH